MRLVAVTSPDSHGLLTEGRPTIGELTAGGTLGLLIFAGIPAGVQCVLLYARAGSVLPRGWRGARVVVAVLALAALPGFVGAVVDILTAA